MDSLYIVTKQEFTSLYRFGKLPITLENLIKIECLSHLEQENLIFNKFKTLPFFVGDEEYLIVKFDANELLLIDAIPILKIEEITEIVPLTNSSRHSLKSKFDSRLHFASPCFEKIVHKLEDRRDIQEMKNGAEVFLSLCKFNSDLSSRISFTDSDIHKIYNFRKHGEKSSNKLGEEFLIHLMIYDRYEYFPKTDIGFFYDVGELFAHSQGMPTFKGSQFYTFLEEVKHELSNKDILDVSKYIFNSNSDLVNKFKNKLTSEEGIRKYILAAMFLKFKEDMANRDTIKASDTGKLIGKIRKSGCFEAESASAIYMTGLFFGYEKFYDDFYDVNRLCIFNYKNNEFSNLDNNTLENSHNLKEEKPDNENTPSTSRNSEANIKNKIITLISESETKKVYVKKDILTKLKKILKHKKIKIKDEIKTYIMSNLSTYIHVEEKGKEFSLKIKGS